MANNQPSYNDPHLCVCYIPKYFHEYLSNSEKNCYLCVLQMAKVYTCFDGYEWLWMAGGLIDLHYHILLLNLEECMHKNRWSPINLQPPHCSSSVPGRRISKFTLLKIRFCSLSLWPWVEQSFSRTFWPDTKFLKEKKEKNVLFKVSLNSLSPKGVLMIRALSGYGIVGERNQC